MIGKIVKGKSFKACVSYVMEKEKAELLHSEGVLDVDTKSIINSFYMQSLLNPKLAKSVGHTSLSFAKEDANKLTDSLMIKLAQEYMKAMKIENTQYIIVRHKDTDHPHCHLVFNRVDNNGKTISDKNDQYRNEKVCKSLKEKYGLTFGEGKSKVNVQKLKGAEQTKYELYHAIKDVLPKAKSWQVFEEVLKQKNISIEYKHKGQTNEVQGISFKKGECSFKGSEVDRSFSYSKLDSILNEHSHSQEQQQINIPKETGSPILESITSGVADTVSSIGGLFDIQRSHYDPNEAEALPKKKKKKPIKRKGIRR